MPSHADFCKCPECLKSQEEPKKYPSKLVMAQTIARAHYRSMNIPDKNDRMVKILLTLKPSVLKEKYDLAVMQVSAMSWNTMTLEIGYRSR